MTAITQTITSAPTPPSRTDPTTFADRSDAFVGYMEDVPVEYNALSSQVNVVASEVQSNANIALSQATVATNAALSASASANFQGNWTATAYTVPSSVFYNGSFWLANASCSSSDVPGISTKWTRYDRNESQFNAKANSQALITTVAASGSTGIQIINDSNINFGTGDFSINIVLAVPDWTPSANVILAQKHDTTNGWILTLLTTGKLRLTINSSTYDSTTAITAANGFTANIVAAVKRSSIYRDGYVQFFQNGKQLGESVAIAQGAPVTVDNTSIAYIAGTSATTESIILSFFCTFNKTISETEAYNFYTNGLLPENKNGTMSAGVCGQAAGQFGSETDIYALVELNGEIYGGTYPNGKLLKWNGSNAWVEVAPKFGSEYGIFSLVELNGEIYGGTALNGKLLKWNGSNAWVEVAPKFGSENSIFSLVELNGEIYGGTYPNGKLLKWNGSNAWVEVAPRFGSESNIRSLVVLNGEIYCGTALNGKLLCAGMGATIVLEPDKLQQKQWFDSSINKLHAMLPAAGTDLKLSKNSFEIRWVNTWAGTHEAQYIGGFNQAILPANCYIESIIGVVSGATIEDIIIGDGSDTDRWVAATTGLAAGTVSFTIANRISDGTNYKMIVDPDGNFTGSISWIIKGIIL